MAKRMLIAALTASSMLAGCAEKAAEMETTGNVVVTGTKVKPEAGNNQAEVDAINGPALA